MPVNLVPKFLNLKSIVNLHQLKYALNVALKFRNLHQLQQAGKFSHKAFQFKVAYKFA